jgi:hypothetical protein
MYSGDSTRPTGAALAQGPWLILDSLRVGEHGWKDRREQPGTLLERRDSLELTFGRWSRVAPDSIVFNEGSVFPAVSWHLRQAGDELRGTGVLVHDVITRGRDGVARRSISRWPVRVVRVPCSGVPLQAWPRQPGR